MGGPWRGGGPTQDLSRPWRVIGLEPLISSNGFPLVGEVSSKVMTRVEKVGTSVSTKHATLRVEWYWFGRFAQG